MAQHAESQCLQSILKEKNTTNTSGFAEDTEHTAAIKDRRCSRPMLGWTCSREACSSHNSGFFFLLLDFREGLHVHICEWVHCTIYQESSSIHFVTELKLRNGLSFYAKVTYWRGRPFWMLVKKARWGSAAAFWPCQRMTHCSHWAEQPGMLHQGAKWKISGYLRTRTSLRLF